MRGIGRFNQLPAWPVRLVSAADAECLSERLLFGFFLKGRSDHLRDHCSSCNISPAGVSLLLTTHLSLLYSTPFLELMITQSRKYC